MNILKLHSYDYKVGISKERLQTLKNLEEKPKVLCAMCQGHGCPACNYTGEKDANDEWNNQLQKEEDEIKEKIGCQKCTYDCEGCRLNPQHVHSLDKNFDNLIDMLGRRGII